MSRGTQRGAVAVEFALIVPLLVALLLAVVTGGVAFSKSVSLNDAVRAGARFGATAPSNSDWAGAVQTATKNASADGLLASDICVQLVSGSAVVKWSTACSVSLKGTTEPCEPVGTYMMYSGLCIPASPAGLGPTECVVKVWAHRSVTFSALVVNESIRLKRAAVLRYERTC